MRLRKDGMIAIKASAAVKTVETQHTPSAVRWRWGYKNGKKKQHEIGMGAVSGISGTVVAARVLPLVLNPYGRAK